jgi:hypothetical protein
VELCGKRHRTGIRGKKAKKNNKQGTQSIMPYLSPCLAHKSRSHSSETGLGNYVLTKVEHETEISTKYDGDHEDISSMIVPDQRLNFRGEISAGSRVSSNETDVIKICESAESNFKLNGRGRKRTRTVDCLFDSQEHLHSQDPRILDKKLLCARSSEYTHAHHSSYEESSRTGIG